MLLELVEKKFRCMGRKKQGKFKGRMHRATYLREQSSNLEKKGVQDFE